MGGWLMAAREVLLPSPGPSAPMINTVIARVSPLMVPHAVPDARGDVEIWVGGTHDLLTWVAPLPWPATALCLAREACFSRRLGVATTIGWCQLLELQR
jgi:hypothetical protein